MSILGSIMSAIFGHAAGAQPSSSPSPSITPAAPSATVPQAGGAGVDIEAVLKQRADQKNEKLDWRRSIVDLMKVLDLDSGLTARKQLAQELGYKGELNGSVEMNTWLHKQVMQKVAANGGKVPAELLD